MEARTLRKIDEFKYSFRDVDAVQEIPFVENKGKNIVIHFHWKYSFALLEREKKFYTFLSHVYISHKVTKLCSICKTSRANHL